MNARDDARVCVRHGDMEVHRYRGQLNIAGVVSTAPDPVQFVWNGQGSMTFPTFAGTLKFVQSAAGEPGIQSAWLLGRPLELRLRQGGERLKLALNRPTRDMKSHYQTFGIPYWQRERLPFVFSGKDLLFAAGVGVHGSFLATADNCVCLHWVAD